MSVPRMSTKVSNAIGRAVRLVGHTPTGYDIDAIYGSLLEDGVHVTTSDDIEAQMFQDRCDYECSVCHPEDET